MALCYLCAQSGTTTEHLPPKVFFPEHKDLVAVWGPSAPDLRTNLLTVRACKAHNNAYSSDDEYAAYVIASSALSNAVGPTQWKTKVLRALQNNSNLAALFTTNATPVAVNGIQTVAYTVDRGRLSSVMQRVAKGIYLKETSQALTGNLIVSFPGLAYIDGTTNPEVALTILCGGLNSFPWKGANQMAFRYQVHDVAGILVMRFQFYEGFEVIVTRQ